MTYLEINHIHIIQYSEINSRSITLVISKIKVDQKVLRAVTRVKINTENNHIQNISPLDSLYWKPEGTWSIIFVALLFVKIFVLILTLLNASDSGISHTDTVCVMGVFWGITRLKTSTRWHDTRTLKISPTNIYPNSVITSGYIFMYDNIYTTLFWVHLTLMKVQQVYKVMVYLYDGLSWSY